MKHAKEVKDPHGQAFLDAVKGIDAYKVAQVLWSFTPGTDWRGCTKGHMANEYASAMNGTPYSRMALRTISLDALRRRAIAAKAGDRNWRNVR